ncbi:uncharacterized protein LOC115322732 isoform X2 [Ixodes scapularis]|uniref:uncharacterized protein LOC115322732 isoform X2 n=1 Tax=Ixodes scapularis TaxID=6945 RepID=UPI001A9FF8DF|nr:uncharacterized protein LOC115322732 isoform X2 [Ixodes scapularis]
MPNVCFVKTCRHQTGKNVRKGLRFFSLPEKEPRRTAWLRCAGRGHDIENLPLIPRFCAEHFEPTAFRKDDLRRSRLRSDAVPTLLLPVADETDDPPPKRQKVVTQASATGLPAPCEAEMTLRDCTAETNIPAVVPPVPVADVPAQSHPPESAFSTCSSGVPYECTSPVPSNMPDSDATYSPSHSEDYERIEHGASAPPPPPEEERQFLVFESCLRELFKTCQECSRLCQTTIETTGTLITVYSICPVEHVRTWKSQPIVNGRPAGNILLTSHLVFSGVKIAPTLRMLRHMNVQVISDSSFYEHRKAFALPAIHKVWLQEQQELLNELQNKEVDISADGRFDSPGFCAKYLTYTVHVEQINKILHSVQVQLKESEQAMASVNMEKEGLLKQLQFFKEKGIKIRSLVTDRHPATRKHMKTHEPGIDHFFDIWHISKSVKKKLTAASKRAGCQDLQIWIQTATNHMYWSARAAGGDEKLLIDIWLSMHNHVINKHSGHEGAYGRCLHGDMPEPTRPWMDPNSQAYNQFKSITGNKLLLKDLAQMSPHGQTYALEAFHSVLIDFAPKSQAFSPEGMLAKTRLAILHFNENSNRCQAVTREGKPRWSVVTSKARKGHHTARPEITDPTYKYVGKLIKEAMESSKQWRSLAAASRANTVVFPAPMTAAYTRPPKEELVAARMSRFGHSPQ